MAEQTVSAEQMLIEQAIKAANKPPRTKSSVLLVKLVEFANSGDKARHHLEQTYPSVTATRINQLIKSSKALTGKVWAIKSDDFGVSLINVTPTPTVKQ